LSKPTEYKKAQVWIANTSKENNPKVLLFRVVKERGSGWHPVTGHIDEGETVSEGARRELKEETGFDSDRGAWIDLKQKINFTGRYGPVTEQVFLFILDGKTRVPHLDPKEHVDFEWVEVKEAVSRLGFAGQKDALKRVSDILKSR
jgi:8-oxo-dGTP pyrophosphatase MutT (NUDIX family)